MHPKTLLPILLLSLFLGGCAGMSSDDKPVAAPYGGVGLHPEFARSVMAIAWHPVTVSQFWAIHMELFQERPKDLLQGGVVVPDPARQTCDVWSTVPDRERGMEVFGGLVLQCFLGRTVAGNALALPDADLDRVRMTISSIIRTPPVLWTEPSLRRPPSWEVSATP